MQKNTTDIHAPTEADYAPIIDQQAKAVDASMDAVTPTGSFSGARLRTFSQAVYAATALLTGTKVAAPDVKGADESGNKPVSWPLELVKRYAALYSATKGFAEANPDEEPVSLPDTAAIAGDGDLALATVALNGLVKNRPFARWLKESPAEEEEASPMDATPMDATPNVPQTGNLADFNSLFQS